MDFERAIIGVPDLTSKFTFSDDGGAWDPNWALDNMKAAGEITEPLSNVARTTGVTEANTRWLMSSSIPFPVRLIVFVNHNGTLLNGQVNIQLYSDQAATQLVHETGYIDLWPQVYTRYTTSALKPNSIIGKYEPEEIEGRIPQRPIWLGQLYFVRAIRFLVRDTTNAAGYFQIGRLIVTPGLQVLHNPDYNAQFGFKFRDRITEGQSGAEHIRSRPKRDIYNGQISFQDSDFVRTNLVEHQRQFGIDRKFFWFPYPDDPVHWLRDAFYARNNNPGLFTDNFFKNTVTPIKLIGCLD